MLEVKTDLEKRVPVNPWAVILRKVFCFTTQFYRDYRGWHIIKTDEVHTRLEKEFKVFYGMYKESNYVIMSSMRGVRSREVQLFGDLRRVSVFIYGFLWS